MIDKRQFPTIAREFAWSFNRRTNCFYSEGHISTGTNLPDLIRRRTSRFAISVRSAIAFPRSWSDGSVYEAVVEWNYQLRARQYSCVFIFCNALRTYLFPSFAQE